MVGHQEFQDSPARSQNFFGTGDHLHAWLDRANAGSREDARAGIHNAKPADAHGSLALQMAKRWDVDSVHARGIEDARAGGHANRLGILRAFGRTRTRTLG